jgi:myo-inositol 2-dehydrogenase/D-chiro-inositol 1-dehydrogenase
MTRLMRIGFVGCGNHATQNIYPALRLGINGSPALTEPIGELVACCDMQEHLAKRNARVFGFERWYTNHLEMLEKEDLDCVIAVLRPKDQPGVAIDCLNAGLPVLIEKPPTTNLADAYAIKDACERSGKSVMIAFMKRFSAPYLHAKEIIADPGFGPLTAYEARYNYQTYASPDTYDFLNAFSCHHLDLARFFMGEVASVFASYASRQGGAAGRPLTYEEVVNNPDKTIPQEEAWLLNFQFESGAVGFLQTNCLERVQERVLVTGQNSWVEVQDWRKVVGYVDSTECPRTWEPHDQLPNDALDFRTVHGYTGEVREFVLAARDGRTPVPNIDDGIAHLKIELAAKKSALEHRPVAISEIA